MPTQISGSQLKCVVRRGSYNGEFIRTFSFLRRAPKDLITPADARANLVILSFCVAGSVKLRLKFGWIRSDV